MIILSRLFHHETIYLILSLAPYPKSTKLERMSGEGHLRRLKGGKAGMGVTSGIMRWSSTVWVKEQ